MFGKSGVELVLDDASFDPRPALFDVDLEDPVHVPRDVDHEPVCQRLAIGPGAAAPRGKLQVGEARILRCARDTDEVVHLSRERDCLGCELIDRVVGRQHGPVGIGLGQITGKAARPQLGQECRVQRRRTGYVGEAWDHDVTSLRNAGWAGSVLVRTTTRLSTQISARDRPGWRVENAYWAALFWCERWAGHKPHKRTKCQHGWPDRRELSTRKASNSIAMERIET